jgi:hypothetical protein
MGPTSARTLAFAVPRELEYVSANGRRSLVIRRGTPPDCLCAGRTWTIKGYELDGPPDAARAAVDSGVVTPTWERTYTVLPGGGIGLTEQIDRAERVEVVFTPPMLIMPDNLPIHALGSAEMAQDFTMTVHPLGDRSRVKSRGPARTLVRYAADEALRTPAGAFTARRLETTLTADLSPAKVSNTTRQWFVENVGLVKEDDRETTKVLGLSVRNNTSEWTLHAFR